MRVNLETDRLILRPFSLSDANDMFYGWANDCEVTKYLSWNAHKDIKDTEQILNMWVEQYSKPERINFAITLKEDKTLIGGIDVVGYLGGVPVIGYVIGKKYWQKGYMTEACQKVINFLYSLGYDKIIIDAAVENIASNKVILKCGGIYKDTYEDFFESKNAKFKINRYVLEK